MSWQWAGGLSGAEMSAHELLHALRKDQSKSASFKTIAGALIPAAFIASAYLCGFLLLRGKYASQYAPRTYSQIIPEKDRTPSTSTSGTRWFRDFRHLDDKFVLRHHSFDAFLFLRFFRMLVLISVVGSLLTWPVLFPLNATGGGGAQELDKLAFSNIANARHCWGTVIIAILFLSFIILVITRERLFLINFRQIQLTSKPISHRLSSRVVLFLSVPYDLLSSDHLERIFGNGVQRIWKVTKLNDLKQLVDDRNQKVYDLEAAELIVAKNVLQQRQKANNSANGSSLERGDASVDHPHNRPTHRSLPLVGQKLDTIDDILSSVPELDQKISDLRETYKAEDSRHTGAVFVEFKNQTLAHQALQQVQHHSPLSLQPRYIGIAPSNVKWQNLAMDPSVRISKKYTAIVLIIAITIFWSIPVGIVATISNVEYLANNYQWLAWINKLPDWLIALIQGYLPPTALSMLTSYVPFWFRDIAELSGEPTQQAMEAMTQRWYFVFQFLQVFLVTTLSSGASAIVKKVGQEPGKIPDLLAANLPKSSNFYLTYFTLQGLSTTASQLIKYSDTFEYVFFKWWARTPRQKYEQETKTRGLFYGNSYAKFANLAVIAIVYSCIAPLVMGFAAVGFTLFYLTYKYLYLYTNNVKVEMRGTAHARALQQMLTGVYVAELCLIGLFGARDAQGPGILMIIFFVLTIIHHYTVNKYLSPMEKNMPLDILQEGSDENNEEDSTQSPLLSDQPRHKISSNLPSYLDPLKGVLNEYNILPSASSLRPYLLPAEESGLNLRESSVTSVPEYTDQQIENAYLHPALTSKAPLVWLPKDNAGVSEEFKKRNKERADLETTDEDAELDEHGNLRWNEHELSKAPIFKLPTKF